MPPRCSKASIRQPEGLGLDSPGQRLATPRVFGSRAVGSPEWAKRSRSDVDARSGNREEILRPQLRPCNDRRITVRNPFVPGGAFGVAELNQFWVLDSIANRQSKIQNRTQPSLRRDNRGALSPAGMEQFAV